MNNLDTRETLGEFIESYFGVDWDTITLAITYNYRVYLFQLSDGMARLKMPTFVNKYVRDWTHDENVMVISLSDE